MQDALELLLPDAEEEVRDRARKVTTFLRLLASDAHPSRALTVSVDLHRARNELEVESRERLRTALTDLLRYHLQAAAGSDSFLWCGAASLELQQAWRNLEEFRGELEWLADVPEPGEEPRSVARRLLACLERLLAGAEARETGANESAEPSGAGLGAWRARLSRVEGGAREGEAAFRAELAKSRKQSPAHLGALRECLAGTVECLLDRGAVLEARALLREQRVLTASDVRLRRLLVWAELLCGDFEGAKRSSIGLAPWSGPLPAPLIELRGARPEWLPCLAGRRALPDRADAASPSLASAGSGSASASRCEPASRAEPGSRAEIGAAVLCAFTFRDGGPAAAVVVDVAPGLRGAVREWLAEREAASSAPGEPEHRLIVQASAVVIHREGTAPPRGALGRETTRALAWIPVPDPRGEVAGWLHLEFEHHLVPSASRLAQLAGAWRARILAGEARAATSVTAEPRSAGLLRDEDVAGGPVAEVFHSCVRELGIKTIQRRWWGFEAASGDLVLAAVGGEGLPGPAQGGRLALQRARVARGSVLFSEPDPGLSIHAGAASGIVLPLRQRIAGRGPRGARVAGFLAIESSRKRDFRESDLERFAEVAESFGLALGIARFRAWHRERFGADVFFDVAEPRSREALERLFAVAASRAPAVLAGPAGSGKLVLARLLHCASDRDGAPLAVLPSSAVVGRGALGARLAHMGSGGLVLDDVDRLAPEGQEELLGLLEGAPATAAGGERPRLYATTRSGLLEAAAQGRLRDDLARRLDRLQIRVPPLAERRSEIPGLASFFAERCAGDEGLSPPRLSDEALGLLWRQRWTGNLRELEGLVYKLVLLHPGEVIEAEHVRSIARAFRIELVRRLPSRHPDRSDVLAALRSTSTAAGRPNKTRAAMYLGWDPDTLVARMQEGSIEDADLAPESGREADPETDHEPEREPDHETEGSCDRPAGER